MRGSMVRVDALQAASSDSDDGANLLTAYKRAANILRIEEKDKRGRAKKTRWRLSTIRLRAVVEAKISRAARTLSYTPNLPKRR